MVITNPQNTTNDPTIALVEVPQSTLPLSLVEDCYNSEGEPILSNSIHGDFPESPDDYLDYSNVISDNEAVDEKFLEPEQSSEVRPEPETTYHLSLGRKPPATRGEECLPRSILVLDIFLKSFNSYATTTCNKITGCPKNFFTPVSLF